MNGIIVGVLGFLTAVVTNLDRLEGLWKWVSGPTGSISLSGHWLGVYRDVAESLDRETFASESLDLRQRGTEIAGTGGTSSNSTRSWEFRGVLHAQWTYRKLGPFLVLNYMAPYGDNVPEKDRRASVGTYVLEWLDTGNKDVTEFRGYWFGHEPDVKKLMSCPYVLSNDSSEKNVRLRHKAWLDQRCSYRADAFPGSEAL